MISRDQSLQPPLQMLITGFQTLQLKQLQESVILLTEGSQIILGVE